MSEKGKKNKKKTGLGLAIWILLFLIILIVFLVKQEEIKENFDKSGATALIEKKIGKDIFEDKKESPKSEETGEIVIDLTKNLRKTEPVAKSEPKTEEPQKIQEPKTEEKVEEKSSKKIIEAENSVQPVKTEEKKTEVTLKPVEKTETKPKIEEKRPEPQKTEPKKTEPKQTQTVTKTEPPVQTKAQPQKAEPKPEPKPAPEPVVSTIKAKICFVAIDSEGPVVRKIVTRSVHKDSPMGDSLNQLLQGPTAGESSTGCRSLIPEGTRLLSASIKNGVAILNFSEEFQFNQFGAEGSLAQLMQVVYTATEFSTVKSVQILIEGQKRDYLTEGVWIGSPLNRSSF
jgi:spore germination protein GerM